MDDMKDTDSNTLARIDERTSAQTIAFALHVKDDSERFDKVFAFVSKRFDKIDEKMDSLWDDKNRRGGAVSLSKIVSGGAWAAIVLAASYFLPEHKP